MANAQAANLSTNRGLKADLPAFYATDVDRWAIVVGISKYKDSSINLKYADRDAEALYELLKTPTGGGFEEAHICKLVNEEATTANITRALRSFLKKPGKQDIVLLYFACHGAPDRDRPDILYLLTHDTDPKDVAGTALPMREINLSLKENLLAERVIIVADTCHSAGISKAGTRDVGQNSGVINRYLQEVGESQKGIALLTSAEANQVSFEDEKWGGGHGVFTHYLLEGMRGAADCSPKNGIVTVGELFEYVRENVKRATEDKQHPCIGPDSFDRNLPVAITAGISAQEHYELGCQLYQIALKLDDKYCFESASRHLREAIRQAAIVGQKLPEAHLQLGLALTATGSLPDEAVTAFKSAIKTGVSDAEYYLGIAYLNQGEVEAACQHLKAFLNKQPDSDKADTLQELVSWFGDSNSFNSAAANRYALLIGINYSENPMTPSLQGPVNDVEILNEVLSKKYNFAVKTLIDMEATCENITNAFQELQKLTTFRDIVLIYYSGLGQEDYWMAADGRSNGPLNESTNVIGGNEIYSLVAKIPALHKTLIMDSEVGSAFEGFVNLARQTKVFNLFLSASPNQSIREVYIEDTQKTHGYFTYALVQELNKASDKILLQDLFERVREAVQSKLPHQTPLFVGDLNKLFFFPYHCLDPFTFSQRRCYSVFGISSLQTLYQTFTEQFTTVFSDFYHSLGLAFLEKGDNQALDYFIIAAQSSKERVGEKLFGLGLAQFNNQFYEDAVETFQEFLKRSESSSINNLLNDVVSVIDNVLIKSKCHALIIGIDTYLSAEALISELDNSSVIGSGSEPINGTPVSGALVLRNILINKYGFQAENVKVLLNEEATYEKILTAFRELVAVSQANSTLFYFAGRGSNDTQDNPTILAFDSRSLSIRDIQLSELANLTDYNDIDLFSIIDSNWTWTGTSSKSDRYTPPDTATYPSGRKVPAIISESDRENAKIPRIGLASIYPSLIRYKSKYVDYKSGSLTSELIQFLKTETPITVTYQKLISSVKEVHFLNDEISILKQNIFSNHIIEAKIRAALNRIEQEPTRHAALILQRLIEQRSGADPEELFNLGIAYYRLNEYDKSMAALQTAIDQVTGQSSNVSEQFYPEAHYWLGRVLYESKRDPARAVSELRLATQQSPDNSAAHYYLGKALRALVEQEILTEAERAFQAYLNAGAPLGQQEEVQEFLKSRKQ